MTRGLIICALILGFGSSVYGQSADYVYVAPPLRSKNPLKVRATDSIDVGSGSACSRAGGARAEEGKGGVNLFIRVSGLRSPATAAAGARITAPYIVHFALSAWLGGSLLLTKLAGGAFLSQCLRS